MTGVAPGMAADDEPYAGPPPTRPPVPWTGAPGPWPSGPWQPAPGQRAPWQPAPWHAGPWPPPPAPWGPPPWAPVPPPYAVRWVPPGTPPHDVPQPFLHAMRSRTWGAWRPVVGLLLFVVVYAVVAILTFVLGIVGLLLADGSALAPDGSGFTDQGLNDMSGPGVLLVVNLVTMVAIPVVWLVWAVVHGMRIGWSSSVLGRLRWRLLPSFTLHALLTIGVGLAVSLALAVAGGWEVTGPVAAYGWLLVVVILTTPLQSAAEEYVFRGYLSQAVAAWVRDPRTGAILAAVVTATLFSFAHLPADLPTFTQFFVVGLAASAVVWLTGGLEAAIALHAVNNVVIFVLAGALGEDVTAATESDAGVLWFDVALTIVALAAFVALVARSRGRLRPETSTAAVDLRLPVPGVLTPAR
jgi:membrane protease YdiL (CAAX protease family)